MRQTMFVKKCCRYWWLFWPHRWRTHRLETGEVHPGLLFLAPSQGLPQVQQGYSPLYTSIIYVWIVKGDRELWNSEWCEQQLVCQVVKEWCRWVPVQGRGPLDGSGQGGDGGEHIWSDQVLRQAAHQCDRLIRAVRPPPGHHVQDQLWQRDAPGSPHVSMPCHKLQELYLIRLSPGYSWLLKLSLPNN